MKLSPIAFLAGITLLAVPQFSAAEQTVEFAAGPRDATLPLAAYPALVWNTFLGGTGYDYEGRIARDADGNLYVAGRSDASWGAPVRAWTEGYDAFVAKIGPDGTLLWNTFLGGTGADRAYGIVIDGDGGLYVAGDSTVAWGAPKRAYTKGYDAFVARIDADGNILWTTFLGGSSDDTSRGIARVASGGICVTGWSNSPWENPVRPFGGSGGWAEAFVAMLDGDGNFVWNTFLGGLGDAHDEGYAIAVDADDYAFVTGSSQASWGDPVRPWTPNVNAFVAKLDGYGNLVWNTFLGGTSDRGTGIVVDSGGSAYVAGSSRAPWGYPAPCWRAHAGNGFYDAFVARLASDGALLWNTFLGGSGIDYGAGIVLDAHGNIAVVGESGSTWETPFDPFAGQTDAFVARLDSWGTLMSNAFFGAGYSERGYGIAFDELGNVYLAGDGNRSWGTPVLPWTASYDAIVVKIANMLNARPVAFDGAVSTPEDTRIGIYLWATDGDGDPLTLAVVAPPAHGTLSGVPPSVLYVPEANYAGTDSFTFKASDGGYDSNTATVTITVTPVSDPPSGIGLSGASVPENSPAGTAVGAFATSDGDPDDTFTYTLVSGTGSTGNASFAISGNSLLSAAVLDFESGSSHSIRVRATDRSGLSCEEVFTVSVGDVNEAPTGITLAGGAVAENQPAGTAAGTLSAADPDGATPALSLVAGAGDADNGLFEVSGNVLRTTATFDHEAKAALSVRIRAEDPGGLSLEQAFTIAVSDMNEPPVGLLLSKTTVGERQPLGALIGTLGATDPDAGESFAFTAAAGDGDEDNGAFAVLGAEVRSAVSFDLALRNAYRIRLRVADQGGLWFEQSFVITVTENQAPTDIALAPASIAENQPAGTAVGTLTTNDPDGEEGFAFELIEGAGGEDNGSFAIDGATVRGVRTFDYETRSAYSILVRATDPGGASCDRAIPIAVANVNDAPAIEPLAGRQVAAGILLSFPVRAADEDGDTLSCEMTSAPSGALFEQDTCTFRWTPAQTQVGDWLASFHVLDNGVPAGRAEASAAIVVTPPLFFDAFTDGTSSGDPNWLEQRGNWSVDGKKRLLSTPTMKNLALARGAATAKFARGRISAKITLGQAPSPNAAIVFGYRRTGATYSWRSVTLGKNRIVVGDQSRALSTKSAPLAVNRRYTVTLDLLADGRVNIAIDGVTLHTFKFAAPIAGQIGLSAEMARSYFDDVTVWTPSMLAP